MSRAAIVGLVLGVLSCPLGFLLVLALASMFPAGGDFTDELRTRAEIAELSRAVEAFKARFGRYPPSQFNANDPKSIDWVRSCFPHANPIHFPPSLEGQECLVFFLGGRQTTVNGQATCRGFSRGWDPLGSPVPNELRIGPFFEFRSHRLHAGPKGFFNYHDPCGTPYVYFSSGADFDSYNPTDCISLGVAPYRKETEHWNPDTFQIISAGRDRTFGPGGLWAPATAASIYPRGSPGSDDQSNFYSRPLGQ